MNDQALFATFLQDHCGLENQAARGEIISFIVSFQALLGTTDEELDTFVKSTHDTNSARHHTQRILIPPGAVIKLKALLFELKDRERCGALPNLQMLQGLNAAQLAIMRTYRAQAKELKDRKEKSNLQDIDIPKFTGTNHEEFSIKFRELISRTESIHGGTSLLYLLRVHDGVYDAPYETREDKLCACLRLNGPDFKRDSETLYSLYVQYIGTEGHGSNIVNKFQRSKNGYKCHHEFETHFKNDSYLDNKASSAKQAIANAVYRGERRNFTLDSYYHIMSKAFNDLQLAGDAHTLNEHQKVLTFEGGLKDKEAITWYITAKEAWNRFPAAQQTFDTFYNEFSKYMNKVRTLSTQDTRNTRIAAFNTNNTGNEGGRPHGGRGRGFRGRGGRGGRGRSARGSGRGRGGRGRGFYHNLYNPYRVNTNFRPEARNYPRDEWDNLTNDQKLQIQQLKANEGWVNGYTPPHGFSLNDRGYPVPSHAMVSAVQSIIGNTNTSTNTTFLPPPPVGDVPVPPVINTVASQAGNSFGRSGSRQPSTAGNNDDSTIGMVSVNGRNIQGPIFDGRGNRLA